MYLWIFAFSYLVSFLAVIFWVAKRLRGETNLIVERGADQLLVDQFYPQATRSALKGVVQLTAITGTFLGSVGSLLRWLVYM